MMERVLRERHRLLEASEQGTIPDRFMVSTSRVVLNPGWGLYVQCLRLTAS